MRIFQVDAFTRTRFTGNPATVVLDADGQPDSTLQTIAREFAHAETAFVLATRGGDHDLRLRFFNARKEAPFVGHATLAAHAVLVSLGRRPRGISRQLSGTGILEVTARDEIFEGVRAPVIDFRQTLPELDNPLPHKTMVRVAEVLRLPPDQLHEMMPARIARKGASRLLIPIAQARGLDQMAPDFDRLTALSAELGADGFFIFAVTRGVGEISTDARMFCPALGIPEDPVSGNAHAMLACYLWEMDQFEPDVTSFVGRQGRHVKRPGEVSVRLEVDEGELVAAHIGGSAVIVSDGLLML